MKVVEDFLYWLIVSRKTLRNVERGTNGSAMATRLAFVKKKNTFPQRHSPLSNDFCYYTNHYVPGGRNEITIHKFNKATQKHDQTTIKRNKKKIDHENRVELTQCGRTCAGAPPLPPPPPTPPSRGATWRRRQSADEQLWLNKYRPRRRLRRNTNNRWIQLHNYYI